MRQRLSASRAVARGAGSASAAFSASIVPYAGSILGRFWRRGRNRRSSRGGRNRHRSRLIGSLLIVKSLVMQVGSTAYRAVALLGAPASRAVVRANVMLHAAGRYRRILVGRRKWRSRWRQHVGGVLRLFQGVGRFFSHCFVIIAGKGNQSQAGNDANEYPPLFHLQMVEIRELISGKGRQSHES